MHLYEFRSDFSYLKYWENKSHFDRVEFAIDESTRKLIASNEALQQQNAQLTADINSGMETISLHLSDVTRGIDGISAICENGFAQLDNRFYELDRSIDELIGVIKSPDQTWANEQYAIAQDVLERGLYADTLRYVDRAISGHQGQSGYALESRFYVLRGSLHLGSNRNTDPEIVDPVLAIKDFEKALKYARNDREREISQQLLGLALYCVGQMADAVGVLSRCVEINVANGDAQFLLAKSTARNGEPEFALAVLEELIMVNPYYAIRALSDGDFAEIRNDLRVFVERYRDRLLIIAYLRGGRLSSVINANEEVLRENNVDIELPLQYADVGSAPITDLLLINKQLERAIGAVSEGIRSAVIRLNAQKERKLESSARSISQVAHGGGDFSQIAVGAVAFLVVCYLGFVVHFLVGVLCLLFGWVPAKLVMMVFETYKDRTNENSAQSSIATERDRIEQEFTKKIAALRGLM